jgi:hypothetical protein
MGTDVCLSTGIVPEIDARVNLEAPLSDTGMLCPPFRGPDEGRKMMHVPSVSATACVSPGYRLPHEIAERLEATLAGRKNASAARALAEWLARWWSAPRRLLYAFVIDRREVAGRTDLGLTEARVRGAIAALVEIGFLARYEPDPGKCYQRTADGLQRRPIRYRFGEEYAPAFARANARAVATRSAHPPRRPDPRAELRTTASARPEYPLATMSRPSIQLTQMQSLGGSRLYLGEQTCRETLSPLEAALERLRWSIGA